MLTILHGPRWAAMWLLALLIFFACKWLTWRRSSIASPIWRHVAYFLAWPGLDADAFLDPARTSARPPPSEWWLAIANAALGSILVFVGPIFISNGYLLGWAGIVGIVLFLHFGSLGLLSCLWRYFGVEARPLMNWPILSTSVSQFWTRWNTAFRDLAHRSVFRPLCERFGPRVAILGGFLFSGVLHDLVISVPAGSGYGGPTLFFSLQGVAVLCERTRLARRLGLGKGLAGWVFTVAVLLVPIVLLVPHAFVLGVIVPFLEAL